MTLPAWATPTQGRTVTLPAVSEAQLRRAEDMLEIWGHAHRRRDAEIADTKRGDMLGRLIDLGPEAMMAPGHLPDLPELAKLCDSLLASMGDRHKDVLRRAYRSFDSPRESALKLFRAWIKGRRWDDEFWLRLESMYWAELLAAKTALARKLPKENS